MARYELAEKSHPETKQFRSLFSYPAVTRARVLISCIWFLIISFFSPAFLRIVLPLLLQFCQFVVPVVVVFINMNDL